MKLLTSFQSYKGLGIGSLNGSNSGISSIYLGERTIQLNTQTGIGSSYYTAGYYDNHSGALLWCALPDAGWGSGSLNVAIASNWGTYQTAAPALTISQYFTQVYATLQAQTVALPIGVSLGAWDDGSSYGLLTPDNNALALYNVDTGQYYLSPYITVDGWGGTVYLSGAIYMTGTVTHGTWQGTPIAAGYVGSLPWSQITSGKPTTLSGYGITDAKTLSAFGTKSGSTGTLGGSGATVYYRNLTVDGVTVQVLCFT